MQAIAEATSVGKSPVRPPSSSGSRPGTGGAPTGTPRLVLVAKASGQVPPSSPRHVPKQD